MHNIVQSRMFMCFQFSYNKSRNEEVCDLICWWSVFSLQSIPEIIWGNAIICLFGFFLCVKMKGFIILPLFLMWLVGSPFVAGLGEIVNFSPCETFPGNFKFFFKWNSRQLFLAFREEQRASFEYVNFNRKNASKLNSTLVRSPDSEPNDQSEKENKWRNHIFLSGKLAHFSHIRNSTYIIVELCSPMQMITTIIINF